MFSPDYLISSDIVKNISTLEYAKAVVENLPLLPKWENQLKKDALVKSVYFGLKMQKYNFTVEKIKLVVDEIDIKDNFEISNYIDCLKFSSEVAKKDIISESDFKNMHFLSAKNILPSNRCGAYRNFTIPSAASTEEILARVVSLIDFLNSKQAALEHPVIVAAIGYAQFLKIKPFENTNVVVANALAYSILKMSKYDLKGFLSFEEFFSNDLFELENQLNQISTDNDFSAFIEFFVYALASKAATIKENVILLSKDSKVEKISKGAKLSVRQQRILEYLQDYGYLSNKDFPKIFPSISEDSVLRDLKFLISNGFVEKKGRTKSSRYELK